MRIFVLFLILILGYAAFSDDLFAPKEQPVPSSLVQKVYAPPIQSTADFPGVGFKNGSIDFLASYDITARVLSRSNYRFDTGSKIAPMDLALGWGPMSLPGLSEKLSVTQSFRYYRYSWKDTPPLDPGQIAANSANVHIIPANDTVKSKLDKIHKGQIVNLQGFLVRFQDENGWTWKSSLTRHDTGDGSCELMYVEDVTVY